MFVILLHSSKTMRLVDSRGPYQAPALLKQADEIAHYLQTLSTKKLETAMHLSSKKAAQTHELITSWNTNVRSQSTAIDCFKGDIYSGLQVQSLSNSDRAFANKHLLILSGLYGGLKALDSVHPYRLEMGYRLPHKKFSNLYDYWNNLIASLISPDSTIINVSAVEYTKAVLPHLKDNTVITPKFMTRNAQTNEPVFVTVHAKIARGAFAHWIIKQRSIESLADFDELGYRYEASLSSKTEPVFVCTEFGGLGLSVRLSSYEKVYCYL